MMKWLWQEMGGHTHVRVYMNGEVCGDLDFRNADFEHIKATVDWIVFEEVAP